MPLVLSDPRICQYPPCGRPYFRKNGQVNSKYCSRKCSCKSRHTHEFQSKAGKAGAKFNIARRGTGKTWYVKELGRHQHRVVMEKKLGRKLLKGEIVHHVDNDKHNNHPDNLEVMTQSQHAYIHGKQRVKEGTFRLSNRRK